LRLPKKLPVPEPGEVVEVAPVRNHAHRAGRVVGANLVRDRFRDRDDSVGPVRDQPHDALERLLLRLDGLAVEAAVGVLDEGVALVGDPLDARQPLDRRADQVQRQRRAGRDHRVDAFALDDPHGGRNRRRRPGDARVRKQQPSAHHPRLGQCEVETLQRAQLLRVQPRFGPEVAGAVDERLGRRAQLVVAVQPLRVVGREDVRLDPERGQVRRQLQRPLNAAPAGGREVHGHEQNLHLKR